MASDESILDRAKRFQEQGTEHRLAGEFHLAAEAYAAAADELRVLARKELSQGLRDERRKHAEALEEAASRMEAAARGDEVSWENETLIPGDTSDSSSSQSRSGSEDGSVGEIEDKVVRDVDVDLSNYVNQAELKEIIQQDVINPLIKSEEELEKFDVDGPVSGILLHGPPGSGKTYFVKCLAGEIDIPMIHLEGAELSSKYVTESMDLIKDAFEKAEELAPVIVFVDEIDTIAMSRDEDMTPSEKKAVSQLLDSIEQFTQEDGIVIGSTNRFEDLDKAVTRSGRLTTDYRVGIPEEPNAVRDIFEMHLGDPETATDLDLAAVTATLQGSSPADIASVARRAKRIALDRSEPLTNDIIDDAISHVQS